jgi:uncharacterized protein (DUF433 family)
MSTIPRSYRYIVRSPDVRGGKARVEGTRIGVHDVVGLLQNGETVDSIIATCFSTLSKAQVYACLAYYEDNKGEIDLLVAQQMAQGRQ